jgi:hypothetical protein
MSWAKKTTLNVEMLEDRVALSTVSPYSPVFVSPQPLPPGGVVQVNPQPLPPGGVQLGGGISLVQNGVVTLRPNSALGGPGDGVDSSTSILIGLLQPSVGQSSPGGVHGGGDVGATDFTSILIGL